MNNHFSEMCIRPLLKCDQNIALIVWCANVADVPQLGEHIYINFFVTYRAKLGSGFFSLITCPIAWSSCYTILTGANNLVNTTAYSFYCTKNSESE